MFSFGTFVGTGTDLSIPRDRHKCSFSHTTWLTVMYIGVHVEHWPVSAQLIRGPGTSPAPFLWVSDVGHGAEPTVAVRRPLSLPWRVLQRKVAVSV